MTQLPQCSDLVRRGYRLEAINVIQASDKCTDEVEIALQTPPAPNTLATPRQNVFNAETIPSDPFMLVGFLLGVALAFGSKISDFLGVFSPRGRWRKH